MRLQEEQRLGEGGVPRARDPCECQGSVTPARLPGENTGCQLNPEQRRKPLSLKHEHCLVPADTQGTHGRCPPGAAIPPGSLFCSFSAKPGSLRCPIRRSGRQAWPPAPRAPHRGHPPLVQASAEFKR